MTSQPLDLTPIQNRLNQAHLAEGHEAKSKAWSDLYQHAPDDIAALIAEIDRLRAEHQEHPNTRMIQTMEELRELPEGTVIHDRKRRVWERLEDDWYTTGSPQTIYTAFDIFPARVIYTPEQGHDQ